MALLSPWSQRGWMTTGRCWRRDVATDRLSGTRSELETEQRVAGSEVSGPGSWRRFGRRCKTRVFPGSFCWQILVSLSPVAG